jgi:secondary thiamine-phosphate synthase enzyme
MQQAQTSITIGTQGKGVYEFTDQLAPWVGGTGIGTGLLSLLCRHTSAGLLINENAASAVKRDLQRWMEARVPEGDTYEHDDEGPDDMPAHIRTMLTGSTLSIPVAGGRMMLGTWQGVYLFEHRRAPHRRTIVAHLIGE